MRVGYNHVNSLGVLALALGVIFIFLVNEAHCQLDGSGSGNDQDVKELGSGSGDSIVPIKKFTKSPPVATDDEDGDTIDEILITVGSGDREKGSGISIVDNGNIRCSDSNLYCWCVSELDGSEIPGTRTYIDDSIPNLDCDDISTTVIHTSPSAITVERKRTLSVKTTSETVKMTDPTTIKVYKSSTIQRRPSTTHAPYVVDESKITTKPSKFDNAADEDEPKLGSDKDGIFRENDVHIVVKRVEPLFTHPGILAAVIGGGVVALLCALLLIMFLVYRMRKKDEGSYPLDPDAKPPRLHTYTRAPTKEYYA